MDTHFPPAALSRRSLVRALVDAGLVAVLFALFARAFLIEVVSIPSDSMSPTLVAGDQVLVDRWIFADPARWRALPVRPVRGGDIVLFRSPLPPHRLLVKRCVAAGGEIASGSRVAPGELFLSGDNRESSFDSRSFGPVATSAVRGRVFAILWSRAASDSRRALSAVR